MIKDKVFTKGFNSPGEKFAMDEEFSRCLWNYSANPVLVVNPDSSIKYINPAFENLTEFSAAELIGKKFPYPFWPPNSAISIRSFLETATSGPTVAGLEYTLKNKSGQLFTVEPTGTPLINSKGKLWCYVVNLADITGRKRAEEKLKESEERCRGLFDRSPDLIYIHDFEGKFLDANPAALEKLGYQRSELDSLHFQSLLDYNQLPSALEKIKDLLAGIVQEKPSEFVVRCKNGHFIDLEIRSSLVFQDGKPVAIQGMARDVTDRKRAVVALRESNQFNISIMQNAPNPVEVINPDASIKYVNPAFETLTGYTLNEIIDLKPPYPWWKNEDAIEYTREFARATEKEIYRSEVNLRNKNGESFWVEKFLTSVKENGLVKYYLSNWVVITERKASQEALLQSFSKYRTLSDSISDVFFSMDRNFNYTYWNRASEKLTGVSSADAIGKNFSDVFPENDVTRKLQNKFLEAITTGETQHFTTVYPGQQKLVHEVSVYPSADGISVFIKDVTDRELAEKSLRDSEEKYRTVVENMQDVFYRTDNQGKLVIVSPSGARLLGYDSVEEIYQKGSVMAFYSMPEDREEFLQDLKSKGKVTDFEVTLKKRDGGLVSVSTNSHIYRDALGKPLGIEGVFRDITARKQAEEALLRSEAKYRSLVETASAGVASVDMQGNFTFLNDTLCQMLGISIDEMLGQPFFPLVHPDDLPVIVSRLSNARIGIQLGTDMEFRVFSRDGRTLWFHTNPKPIQIDGEVTGFSIILHDVSEHKLGEIKLRDAAEEWRTTFDSITDLVYIRNNQSKIIRMNKAFAETFNKKPQELVGRSCCEIVHGTKESHSECPHLKMMETKKSVTVEYFEPNLNMYIIESISPILNEKGEVTGTVNVVKNITEHKQIEQQLIMTDKLATIGELAAGIAHELNNPLTGVIGFSQLIMEGEIPPQIKDDLNIISNEAQRAAKIVKNLLTFARKHQPVKQFNQINDCISEVLNIRAYEQKNRNIKVVTHLDPDLPKIMIDYFQIQQVIINIIINAEFFTDESHNGGTLSITSEKIGDIIRVSFSDDGPGISKENLKHLFNPFFTTKEVGKGTGLGLAICHGIISEHRGRIFAESEPGGGATFIVELPVNY
jgi:PAS domain S-box-containing protein